MEYLEFFFFFLKHERIYWNSWFPWVLSLPSHTLLYNFNSTISLPLIATLWIPKNQIRRSGWDPVYPEAIISVSASRVCIQNFEKYMDEFKVQLIWKIILACTIFFITFAYYMDMSGMKTMIMTTEITMKFLEMGTTSEKFLSPTWLLFNMITKIKSLHFNYSTVKISLKSVGLVSDF